MEENQGKTYDPFSIKELKGVLKEITADFKHQGKNMESAMLKQPVKLQDKIVTFILNGELQEHIFARIKPELTGLLRRKLNNFGLEVQFEIKKEVVEESDKLYTSTDKLAYLCKKSPALKELQKRFGLETDF